MRKSVLVYGLAGGILILALQLIEYRWLVLTRSTEIYGGLLAVLFAGVGLWLGKRYSRPPVVVTERVTETVTQVVEREVPVPVPVAGPFVRDEAAVERLGLTPRELEMLGFIAEGLSNREIAERAGVSENTVKTHSSRVFDKLGVSRRTQAVQRARELRLIP
jgi:DNA-binding NarL/FixJ family response regulator